MKSDLLILFAKAPSGKNVKTRLKTVLTLKERQQLQEALILDTLSLTSSLPMKRVLACTPSIEDPVFIRCQRRQGIDLIAQEGSDLGQQMENAFQWGFSLGFSRIVIVGTDSPTLPAPFITEAFHRLRTVPIVIGPAMDGGYYLIGINLTVKSSHAKKGQQKTKSLGFSPPPIFQGIQWGSGSVLTETIKRLGQYDLLPFWYDVDRPSDLEFLRVHLSLLRRQGRIARETWKQVKRR